MRLDPHNPKACWIVPGRVSSASNTRHGLRYRGHAGLGLIDSFGVSSGCGIKVERVHVQPSQALSPSSRVTRLDGKYYAQAFAPTLAASRLGRFKDDREDALPLGNIDKNLANKGTCEALGDGARAIVGDWTYVNGDRYVGSIEGEERQGHGVMMYADGDRYVGTFEHDACHGRGVYIYPDGESYVGQFEHGMCHGQGVYTFSDGERYVGAFEQDEFSGHGTWTYPDGDLYVGDFKDGARHGHGAHMFATGERYVGTYENDKRHGQGVETYANGDRYVAVYDHDACTSVQYVS